MMKFVELYNNAIDEINKGDMFSAYQCLLKSIQDIEENVINIDSPIHNVVNNNERCIKAYRQDGFAIPVDLQIEIVYHKSGEIAAIVGKTEEVLGHFVNYQKMLMSHFSGDKINKHLFSFRNYSDYSLADLANNTLNISRPKVMNDPFDTPVIEWGKYQRTQNLKPHTEQFLKSFDGYRIRSFSIPEKGKHPIKNLLMWAHYADGHKGFCVEYDFSSEFRKQMVSFNRVHYDAVDLSKEKISITEAFATKSKEWKYENEVRLISYNFGTEGDYDTVFLDDQSSISAIYFGLKCSEERISIIKTMLKGRGIKMYQMKAVGSAIPYKLKPVLINKT